VETLVPEPPRAGVEGVAEEESAPRAPVVEEAHVSVPAEAQDEGVVAAMTAQAATESVIPVLQLLDSSEEFGDSRDIDPCCGERRRQDRRVHVGLRGGARRGDIRGAHHGPIIQSGVPLEFLHNEREEESVWQAQIEAGSQILNHLDRALELHRTTDYQISQVSSSSPGIVRIWP